MKRVFLFFFVVFVSVGLRGERAEFGLGGGVAALDSRGSTEIQILWRGIRLNRATGQWNVDLVARNSGSTAWSGPLVVRIDQVTESAGIVNASGTSGGKAYVDLTSRLTGNRLAPGEETRSIVVVLAGSTRVPTLTGTGFSGPALVGPAAFLRVVDGLGMPLSGVTVSEVGPVGTASYRTGRRTGAVTLGQGEGVHAWTFRKAGHLPAWRRATLAGSGVVRVPGPWLAQRDGTARAVGAGGGTIEDPAGGLILSFPAGAWASGQSLEYTAVGGQTLPGLLPAGWSPMQAFWLEGSQDPAVAGTATLTPMESLAPTDRLAWVRWDDGAVAWRVVAVPTGAGTSPLVLPLARLGAYALVVGDGGATAPGVPVEGALLEGVVASEASAETTTATALAIPASSPASTAVEDVTTLAQVTFQSDATPLASGTLLRCDVTESYVLLDGTTRVTPSYELGIVGHARPASGTPGRLVARFPLRPILLLPGETLDRVTVTVAVRAPVTFEGTLATASGGTATSGSLAVVAGAGDFELPSGLVLTELDAGLFETMAGEGTMPVAAFELVSGDLADGSTLELRSGAMAPGTDFVLGRVTHTEYQVGIEPVARLRSDAAGGLVNVEPTDGNRLGGVDGGGLYVLLKVGGAQALVQGVVRNRDGNLAAGLAVQLGPWTTFTDAAGGWKLVAPAGTTSVVAEDPETGDRTTTALTIDAALEAVELAIETAPSAPRVASTSPEDGSGGVSRVTPVEVVFSKAVTAGSVASDGVRLVDALGETVAASVTLSLSGTVVTLLPTDPLEGDAVYTIVVADTVSDADGRPLEGAREFHFITETAVVARSEAVLVIYEPVDGRAGMSGGSGLAEPESPVILVNETTGYTATVLSRVDGSFSNSVPAGVDDTLLAVLVNRNGTQTVVNTARQVFQDGTIGLFSGGGTVEATGPHGSVEIEVDPGTVRGRALFRVSVATTNEVAQMVSTNAPSEGQVLGAFRFGAAGDLASSPHVAFPFDTNSLPAGVDPTAATFLLTAYHEVDGNPVYEVIDRMSFEDGRLVTHSPPFVGMLLSFSAIGSTFGDILLAPLYLAAGNSMTVAGRVLSGEYTTGGLLVDSTLQPVPGTTVSVYPNGNIGGLPGRLPPGSVTAVARGTNAAFSFVVPANQASMLVARSPRFPGTVAAHAVNPASIQERLDTFGIVTGQDVIFRRPREESGPDWTKPDVVFSHTPYIAAVGSNITVKVTAVDDRSSPRISVVIVEVVSLASGVTAVLSDGTILESVTENLSATTSRNTVTLTCIKAAAVTLRAHATDGSGNEKQADYTVIFGGDAIAGNDPLESPDPRDLKGPRIVSTTPMHGQRAFVPGQSLVLRFNEAISDAVYGETHALQLTPEAGVPALALSADQTELTITYPALEPDTDYTLVVNGGVTDLRSNRMDQDPADPGEQSFELAFRTAPTLTTVVPDAGNTSGSVIRGNHLYTLERGGTQPYSLVVYQFTGSGETEEVGRLRLPGYPRDLVLIPRYSFQRRPDTAVETKDLLAIVGGDIHGSADTANHYLRIVDISDPTNPARIASTTVSFTGSAAVTRVRWSPPYVGFLEIGPAYSVSLVNLQSFIYGLNLTAEEFQTLPRLGEAGVDLNGDGDYVDAGETIPLPPRDSLDFVGRDAQFTIPDSDQSIRDFVLEEGAGFLGVITGSGNLLGTDGLPSGTNAPPSYLTLYWNGVDLPREIAGYVPTGHYISRVNSLFGQTVIRSNQLEVLDLVVLSVVKDDRSAQQLTVLDVSDPTAPQVLVEIPLPVEDGVPVFSVVVRDDGMMVAGTAGDAWLIDPMRFLESDVSGGQGLHPSVAGRIASGGTSAYTFSALQSGWISSVNGSRNRVLFTGPHLEFVSFPGLAPFGPDSLVGSSDADLASVLEGAEPAPFLMPTRFKAEAGVIESGITPPDPASHYYVLVHAPGVVGTELPIALQTLDEAGQPVAPKGFLFPAVHALSTGTQAGLRQQPGPTDAPVRVGRAVRLSDDPASPYYNLFLSRPIALLYEELTVAELAEADAELERELLWSGFQLRASLDPGLSASLLTDFGSVVSTATREFEPGTEVVALSFPADYLMGPNPPPVMGGFDFPGTLGLVGGHNGELQHTSTDMVLPGRRMPLEFRRTSNGQALYNGPFGRGWDFNFNQRIRTLKEEFFAAGMKLPLVVRGTEAEGEIAGQGDLLFYTGGGRTLLFRDAGDTPPEGIAGDELAGSQGLDWLSKADRYYLPPEGVFEYIVHFPTGEYARLTREGMQYWYSPAGRLERVYDRYPENQFELVYNTAGELVRIHDELRRTLDIGYYRRETDRNRRLGIDETTSESAVVGRIARLVDYSGRDVLYHYNAAGLLIRMEGPEVGPGNTGTFTGRQKTHYTYSGTDDPTQTGQTLQAVTSGDEGGTPIFSVAGYAPRGRDSVGQIRLSTGTVTVSQSFANRASTVAGGGLIAGVVTPDGASAEYTLDNRGRTTRSKLAGSGAADEDTLTEYGENGLVRRMTFPEGNSIEYTYDSGNASLRSRANILRIQRDPGPRGGDVLVATSEYDDWYNLPAGAITSESGVVTTVTLRSDHRDTASRIRSGELETFIFNDHGQLEVHTASDGITRTHVYDPATGFLVSKSVGTLTTTFEYGGAAGSRGLVTSQVDTRGVVTQFEHDARNQLVSVTTGASVTRHSYDENGYTIRSSQTVDDGREVVEEHTYNQFGFLTEQRIRSIEVNGEVTDLVTLFEPDELNRVKTVIQPTGIRHEMTYDHAGRLVLMQVPDAGYEERFTYDLNGNLKTTQVGATIEEFFYDGHDRRVATRDARGSLRSLTLNASGFPVVETVTDSAGVLLSAVSREYDDHDRCTAVIRSGDSGSSVVTYAYNPTERTVTVTDAKGAQARVVYDSVGRAVREETPTRVTVNEHDAGGNVTRRTITEGSMTFTETYAYDDLEHLVRTGDSLGQETILEVGIDGRVKAVIDRESNRHTTDHTILGETAGTLSAAGVLKYQQYGLTRDITLVADGSDQAILYAYDTDGRLIEETDPARSTTSYSNFNAFRQAQRIEYPGGVVAELAHDAAGQAATRRVTGAAGTHAESFLHDGLGRLVEASDGSGLHSREYDLLGFIRTFHFEYGSAGLSFDLQQAADEAGFRSSLVYPSGAVTVANGRDGTGRLTSLTPTVGEPVVMTTTYATDTRVATRVLGTDRIQFEAGYDALRRNTAWRYRRVSDGTVLVDVRSAYDRNGAPQARQHVHRGGRADLFQYDGDQRLIRADIGARPSLGAGESGRSLDGFSVPSRVTGDWVAGFHGRSFEYTSLDRLKGATLSNPDGLAVALFAAGYGDADTLGHATQIDGIARERDVRGNVTSTRLAVRLPGSAVPEWVQATLTYNDLGQLTTVTRADGVVVGNEYGPLGLRIRRTVTGPADRCVPMDRVYLYDGGNLVEERDAQDGNRVVARYYHGDEGDELLAGDLDDGTGTLVRRYFLTDPMRSVLAVADAAGTVVERIAYDAWGEPVISAPDTALPQVSRIERTEGGVVVVFSERVLPGLDPTATDSAPVTSMLAVASAFEVREAGSVVSGSWVLEESWPGAGFGTALRFQTSAVLSGAGEIRVAGGVLRDGSGNGVAAVSVPVDFSGATGSVLHAGVAAGSTEPVGLGTSAVGNPFLFHGQVFDAETGLIYCRARYYQPATGLFLQPDPAGPAAGVNPYTAFANNPVSFKDTSGAMPDWNAMGTELRQVASHASYSEDGLDGVLTAAVVDMAGRVLQLGTDTAIGVDLLSNPGTGAEGVKNVARAAELIAGDVLVAAMPLSLSPLGMSAAQRIQGYLNRNLAAPKHWGLELSMRGFTGLEARAIVETMREQGITAMSIRSFGAKAAARRAGVMAGIQQKPRWVKAKTGKDALVTAEAPPGKTFADGTTSRTFVSDADLLHLEINGRLLNESEVRQFARAANQRYIQAWRAAGRSGAPNPPFQHSAHLNMADVLEARWKNSNSMTQGTIYKLGHPGESVGIRINGAGNVVVFDSPRWWIQKHIDTQEQRLRAIQKDLKLSYDGYPTRLDESKSWHKWMLYRFDPRQYLGLPNR